MPRFLTTYNWDDPEAKAFAEHEDWGKAQANADDYVWQFAPDKETAIRQHDAKVDAWREDQDAGRPEKYTY